MTNKIIVFDTETTGFDPKTSEIVQLSYILYDIESQTVEFATKLEEDIVGITGDIPKKTSDIHGITKDRTLDKKPIEEHIDEFIKHFNQANQFVGHNIRFDINMIIGQIEKIIESNPEKESKYQIFLDKFGYIGKKLPENAYCTMENSKVVCSQLKGIKRPKKEKLEDVHRLLFQQNVEGGLHNALVDISVTLRVYLKLTLSIDICETYDRTIKEQETAFDNIKICNIIKPISLINSTPIMRPNESEDYSGELITGFSDLPKNDLEEMEIDLNEKNNYLKENTISVQSIIRKTAVEFVESVQKQAKENVSKIFPLNTDTDTDIKITICTAIIKSGKRKGKTCGRTLDLCRYHNKSYIPLKEKPQSSFLGSIIGRKSSKVKSSTVVPFGGKKNKTMKKNKTIKKNKKSKNGKLYKYKS
jgi:hypothetical protein